MTDNTQTKEFNFIFPSNKYTIAGIEFNIRPFSIGETKIIANKLGPILEFFFSLGDGETLNAELLSKMYGKGYEGIAYVVAYVLNKSGEMEVTPEMFDSFDTKSAVQAIVAIVEVNKDFFSNSVENETNRLAKVLNNDE